jgi:hypothetical protein
MGPLRYLVVHLQHKLLKQAHKITLSFALLQRGDTDPEARIKLESFNFQRRENPGAQACAGGVTRP